jgi:hypothetical protein
MMAATTNLFLLIGAVLSGTAALLHLGCIVFGAPWYRFMGAGEHMAQMALAGHWYPTVVTLAIAAMLAVWALYALSGAGIIARLPLLRVALCVITAVYFLRAVGFAPLMRYFPDNSMTFWVVSSGICLTISLVHALGLWQTWSRL